MSFLDQIPDYAQMGLPIPIDIKQLPIIPYPQISTCLGLVAEEPQIDILEGYMRLGYDFEIKSATETCLFDMLADPAAGLTPLQKLRMDQRMTKMPSFIQKGEKALKTLKPMFQKLDDLATQTGLKNQIVNKLKQEFIAGNDYLGE